MRQDSSISKLMDTAGRKGFDPHQEQGFFSQPLHEQQANKIGFMTTRYNAMLLHVEKFKF